MQPTATKEGLSLWIRFIFSALVDADFLDTEKFYGKDADRITIRRPELTELSSLIDQYIDDKGKNSVAGPINAMRSRQRPLR